jgi:hypothetical protein
MLETLVARLTQAQAGQLGHLDFLQVLCQDEIARREAMSMTRRLRRDHFDQQATLEEFDFAAISWAELGAPLRQIDIESRFSTAVGSVGPIVPLNDSMPPNDHLERVRRRRSRAAAAPQHPQ